VVKILDDKLMLLCFDTVYYCDEQTDKTDGSIFVFMNDP